MAENISRRGFLKGAEAGLLAIGVVALAPGVAPAVAGAATLGSKSSHVGGASEPADLSETLVVHIPNPRSSEIRFMFGTQEVVRNDRALVARLVRNVT